MKSALTCCQLYSKINTKYSRKKKFTVRLNCWINNLPEGFVIHGGKLSLIDNTFILFKELFHDINSLHFLGLQVQCTSAVTNCIEELIKR